MLFYRRAVRRPLTNIFKYMIYISKIWSGRRDSNPRHQPWQGCTLPLSYSRSTEILGNEEMDNMHSFLLCKPLLYIKNNARVLNIKIWSIMTKLDKKLLEVLVCPLSKGALRYDEEKQELISEKSRLAFPIRDGIPIMLVEEARRLDENL